MTQTGLTSQRLYWVKDNRIADDFPDINAALEEPDGLLAIGGDLSPERLLQAYQQGIFPWYSEGQPIMWWSPNPRWVIRPDEMVISKSLRKLLNKNCFTVTFDRAFSEVIKACAAPRKNQQGTWISYDIINSYEKLYKLGYAHSVECWQEGELSGGLYGICIGRIFFGESMFSRHSNTSKIALVHLCNLCRKWNMPLIDCQVYSSHLASLGAVGIPRDVFKTILHDNCKPELQPDWTALD